MSHGLSCSKTSELTVNSGFFPGARILDLPIDPSVLLILNLNPYREAYFELHSLFQSLRTLPKSCLLEEDEMLDCTQTV